MLAAALAIVSAVLCLMVFAVWRGKAGLEEKLRHEVAACAAAEATLAQFSESYDRVRAEVGATQEKFNVLEKDIRDYTIQIATLKSEKTSSEQRLKDQQQSLQQLQDQFTLKFENLANRIFEEKNTQSKQNLKEILAPLKADIDGFKTHVTESFGNHAKEQFALKTEIANVVKAHNEMRFETTNLTKALKGDSKAQGNWGEVMLERILEASGLRKGEDYVPQAAGMGLKNVDDGRIQKPDFVIKLPENKHAIVDSKVSLTAYERYCAEEDDASRALQLTQFLHSVKTHVKDLAEKRYQDMAGIDTPDYVLMFMPIEGAYSLAIQQDPELHAYGWDRKIIIVCPSTLFAILKIIASMWKLERQNRNADEIAKRGGALYDKIVGFLADMDVLGKRLSAAQDSYEGALTKLSKGTGNVLRQAEMLKELGVKNAKSIPSQMLQHSDEETISNLTKEEVA